MHSRHAPAPPRRAVIIGGLAAIAAAGPARAGEAPVFSDWRGRAIRGYDPVAYFTEGRPVRGRARHEAKWNGARWQFASAENRALFLADPERYAPQYGGWCAFGVSEGGTYASDPEQWRIVDGRLYLNYDEEIMGHWQEDIPGRITRADANWPGMLE